MFVIFVLTHHLSFQCSSLIVKLRLGYSCKKGLPIALESTKVVTLEASVLLFVLYGTIC